MYFFAARHVVEEEKDIKRAMEFLHECDLLKIEDILPFFPDFVTIDHFKVIVQVCKTQQKLLDQIANKGKGIFKSGNSLAFRNAVVK